MKYILLFLVTIIFSGSTIGQNVLLLKSGDKMNGKVDKFKNDTLTFIYKGNKLQFKSSEISSIYFDDTQMSNKPNSSTETIKEKQEGKISGVVTYFFNDNFGYKPDVGAGVLIIDSSKVPNLNYPTIDSFFKADLYGITNEKQYDELDKRTWDEISKIKFENISYCKKFIADGNGNFYSELPEGNYYILLTSANRKGSSMTELLGKIDCKKLIVKAGETTYYNKKFDKY